MRKKKSSKIRKYLNNAVVSEVFSGEYYVYNDEDDFKINIDNIKRYSPKNRLLLLYAYYPSFCLYNTGDVDIPSNYKILPSASIKSLLFSLTFCNDPVFSGAAQYFIKKYVIAFSLMQKHIKQCKKKINQLERALKNEKTY